MHSLNPATVNQECITAFNDLKLNKKYKYIVYKLSDDYKEIVVEHASDSKDYDEFREKLINATSKSRSGAVGKGPRYAVYDFEYSLASGDGIRYAFCAVLRWPLLYVAQQYSQQTNELDRNKITFIAWSPDDAGIQVRSLTHATWSTASVSTNIPLQPKMIYASSKEALKRTLTGIAHEHQANDSDDIEYDTILKNVSKGLAA
ncbi:Actin-depolymerizing factor 1 [Fusarium acuminatum]|uniref:Cofilin n=1 Tax=Fusarium acuminatum TaxID=5515 RepID=A0ABZ2X0U7_9HYPO